MLMVLKWGEARVSAAFCSHHRGIPRWLPDEFDGDIYDAIKAEKHVFRSRAKTFVQRATTCSECHGNADLRALDVDTVNEAKVNDVASHFRINHLPEGLEHEFFSQMVRIHKVFSAA